MLGGDDDASFAGGGVGVSPCVTSSFFAPACLSRFTFTVY